MGRAARQGVRGLRRQELIAAVAFIECSLFAGHRAELSMCVNSLRLRGSGVSPTSLLILEMGVLRHREVK